MIKETDFSSRLRQIMTEKNLRQCDLVRVVNAISDETGMKLSQSAVSQYMRSERAPKPDRLKIIASALGVNEYYLLGYNVDRDSDVEFKAEKKSNSISADKYENTLRWLQESGWDIRHNAEAGNYTIRQKGWTYDRTMTISEEEMLLKLTIMIKFADFIMRYSIDEFNYADIKCYHQ